MILSILFYSFIFLIINYLFIKNKYLLDKVDYSDHKKFISKNEAPITGGLFLLISFFLFINKFSLIELTLLTSFFLIGFISDIYKNFLPSMRLALQILIIVLFIFISKISIYEVRIEFLDTIFAEYKILSIIFTVFCITVLVNGSNFIDGVNLSSIGYYLGIFITLYYLGFNNEILVDLFFVEKLILILSLILLINFFNKTLLGDGGIYLIAFTTGFFVIDIIDKNKIISPYFGILIFWYPCFENLFSIIRKKIYKKKTTMPDNLHLHQLIYTYLSVRFSSTLTNNLTGFLMLLFNYVIFYLGYNFFNNSEILLLIFFIAILIYTTLYITLYKNNQKFK
jgi:UDP-N-acetylmuramyl pentapeptide phosphotransferase/UDP-N-acetylglucosamine-1-phosphate transferase